MLVTHRIVDNRVVTYTKILVHSTRISSFASFNDNISKSEFEHLAMKDWLQTEAGQWIIGRVTQDDIEVISYLDPMTMDMVFKVAANLIESDATFFLLKYDIR